MISCARWRPSGASSSNARRRVTRSSIPLGRSRGSDTSSRTRHGDTSSPSATGESSLRSRRCTSTRTGWGSQTVGRSSSPAADLWREADRDERDPRAPGPAAADLSGASPSSRARRRALGLAGIDALSSARMVRERLAARAVAAPRRQHRAQGGAAVRRPGATCELGRAPAEAQHAGSPPQEQESAAGRRPLRRDGVHRVRGSAAGDRPARRPAPATRAGDGPPPPRRLLQRSGDPCARPRGVRGLGGSRQRIRGPALDRWRADRGPPPAPGESGAFLSFSGIEPRYWRLGAAATLTAAAIWRSIDHGAESLNFSSTPDPGKLRWSEQLEFHHEFLVVAPSRRSRLLFSLWWQLHASRALVRSRRLVVDQLAAPPDETSHGDEPRDLDD